jgi:uncharacterized surface protein with fasciclin (FAS1) repeats
VASGDDRLTILVEALGKTGLVGALDGNRQLTVLALTNDAFGDLLDELCGLVFLPWISLD